MRERLPIVLSALALLVALLGSTPLGEAAGNAVRFATNAGKVDGIDASRTPKAKKLLALDAKKRFAAGPTRLALLEGAKCSVGARQGTAHLDVTPLTVFLITVPVAPPTNSGAGSATLSCLAPDVHEPNQTQATPRSISASWGCSAIFPGQCAAFAAGSLYPAGDTDWYSFTGHTLTSLSVGGSNPSIQFDAFKNGVAAATNQTTLLVSGGAGDSWLFHVHGPTGWYTLTLNGTP